MALDVGRARVGVAMSDPTELLASPLTTVALPESERVDALLRLAEEHAAGEIVVGMPLSLSGRRGAQAQEVARFVEALAAVSSVPVTTFDERYSTVEASRLLRQAGAEPSRDRPRLDAAAAAVILQSYLDSRRARP